MVAAPTRLIAIGRKMIVLVVFSPRGPSRSVKVATARPRMTHETGTIRIHSSVLNNVSRNAGVLSRSV